MEINQKTTDLIVDKFVQIIDEMGLDLACSLRVVEEHDEPFIELRGTIRKDKLNLRVST